MTKSELLKHLADAEPNARVTMVDANGFVIDVEEVLVAKADSLRHRDEIQLFRARP